MTTTTLLCMDMRKDGRSTSTMLTMVPTGPGHGHGCTAWHVVYSRTQAVVNGDRSGTYFCLEPASKTAGPVAQRRSPVTATFPQKRHSR